MNIIWYHDMFLHIFSDSPNIFFWQSQVINWICGGNRALSIFHQNISRKWLSSSDPRPDPLFWHSFWHTIWKSFFLAHTLTFFLAFYLASILTFFLAFYLVLSSEILCGWGPAGNTLIRSSRLRSGREHFDPELAVGEHSDPVLAVRVRRGMLRSSACSWGPAEEEEKEAAGQPT